MVANPNIEHVENNSVGRFGLHIREVGDGIGDQDDKSVEFLGGEDEGESNIVLF